ncbi:hypothetical protein ABZR37_03430 [Achromobacter ruhlandii]|uniref:hypothetical protein n=1 Tax=Achromobacter TaxID=222 RepID=UPI00105ECE94|nr:hypothetical protein [Achromobacter xylosoxidans]
MAFIHDAQEILSEEDYAKLKELQQKSAEFETTKAEEEELYNIKKKVHDGVALRDREKNLAFLNGKAYPLAEIINATGYTEDEVKDAVKKLYADTTPAVKIATYKIKGINGKETDHDVMNTGRLTKELKAEVVKHGIKGFLANINDLDWLLKSHVVQKGKYKDSTVYPNATDVAKRFSWDRDDLIKQAQAKHKKDSEQK